MAKFQVIRRKIYVTTVEANSMVSAKMMARDLPGRDWILSEDRLVSMSGVDGHVRTFREDEDEDVVDDEDAEASS